MLGTVSEGGPFVAANATRLHTIAWSLLALQLFGLIIGAIAKIASTPAHPLHLNAGFFFDQRRARRPPHVRAGPRVRGRHACAKTSKGPYNMAITNKLDDLLHDRRMTLIELADRVSTDAGQPLDPQDRQGARSAFPRPMRSAGRSRASLATFCGLSRTHNATPRPINPVKRIICRQARNPCATVLVRLISLRHSQIK
jgi:hypothetical protein